MESVSYKDILLQASSSLLHYIGRDSIKLFKVSGTTFQDANNSIDSPQFQMAYSGSCFQFIIGYYAIRYPQWSLNISPFSDGEEIFIPICLAQNSNCTWIIPKTKLKQYKFGNYISGAFVGKRCDEIL